MPYYPKYGTWPPTDEIWKCSQCARELSGRSMPRRSLIARDLSSTGQAMHSKCARCGYVMCAPCLEMQKPDDRLPDREALCPDCGSPFGDGPILVPSAESTYSATPGQTTYAPPPPARAVAAAKEFDHVKNLRTWAGWLIFWTIINTGSLFVGGGGEDMPELSDGEMAIAFGAGCFLVSIGLLVLASAIACLVTRPPWPGFYIIFGVYLVIVALLNLLGGGFWMGLGVVQLIISVSLFRNYGRYLTEHRAMQGGY